MKTRKSGLWQRTAAVLLAATLVVCMVSYEAPVTVLADELSGQQEILEGNTAEAGQGDVETEEETKTTPAETPKPEEPKLEESKEELPKPEDGTKEDTPEQGSGTEEKTPGTDTEKELQEMVSGNDAAPKSVMMAAAEPQADNIDSGTDWVLAADGKLTIKSDTGMEGWIANGRNTHSSKVTGAEIHNGVTSIPGSAFNGCSGMKNITLSETVTSIRPWAFHGCSSLTDITIPSNVREIGNAAFGRCSSLTTVTMLRETPPTFGADVFGMKQPEKEDSCGFIKNNTQGIHVPAGKAGAYKAAWADWAEYIVEDPAPPESGTVTPEVKPGANAPATSISTPAEELKEMLLTEEEKQQVQNGTDVKIVLEVKDAGNTVSSEDKAVVQQALNGFTVGQYLDIDLYKLVGEAKTDITETNQKIRIVINVPNSLKNADSSKTRTFAVIRVHGSQAACLPDQDSSADTITIETDRFSTYAVVYKDTANGGGNTGGGNTGGGDDSGNTGGGNDGGAGDSAGAGSGGDSGGNGSAGNTGGTGAGSNNTGVGGGSKNSGRNSSEKMTVKQGSAKDHEPNTGDNTPLELCATLSMIAGFAYLLLYFADREKGMTEETKKELVSRLAVWAKRGGRIRRWLALAAIFVLLVYYHSIGKKTCAEWKAKIS